MVSTDTLWKLYYELNTRYFNGAVYVAELRKSKFIRDYFLGTVTFGLFEHDAEGLHSVLHVNKFLVDTRVARSYPWIPEAVVYHEMCHAHLTMNVYPFRKNMYKCDDHGPEFQKLMNQHPKAKQLDKLVHGELSDVLVRFIHEDAAKLFAKKPELKEKLMQKFIGRMFEDLLVNFGGLK